MSENKALDEFAKLLVTRVRDRSIEVGDAIITGRMEVFNNKLQHIGNSFSEEQFEYISQLVPEIVDQTIHYVFWLFEEEPNIKITFQTEGNTIEDIRNITGGELQGYLLDWITKFSNERMSPGFKRILKSN